MALQEDNHVSKTYYSIYDGKVCRQWFQDEAPDGFTNLKSRTTPDSKRKVWYKNYIFKGRITNVYEKKNEKLDGNPMEFYLEIENEHVLVMRSGSGYHKSFLLAMQNFPKGETLTFSPYNFLDREKNKKVIGMSIKDSDGNKIAPFYTKDEPKGLPQPKYNERKNEWNWDDQEDFLYEVFEKWSKEYLAGVEDVNDLEVEDAEEITANRPEANTSDVPVINEVDDEDVPF